MKMKDEREKNRRMEIDEVREKLEDLNKSRMERIKGKEVG